MGLRKNHVGEKKRKGEGTKKGNNETPATLREGNIVSTSKNPTVDLDYKKERAL